MKLRRMVCLLTFLVATTAADAAQREFTIFRDGSLIEVDVVAVKGLAELALPAPIRDNSLRVTPLDNNTDIEQVALVPFRMPDKAQRELDQLAEQKERLEDRLKALDTKEDIFEAAAKSQSSKAPRQTKANPNPLTSVRQGTDFAIAQLEAVITARRRTAQELKRITSRIAELTGNTVGGPTVRISVGTPNGRVRIAAVLIGNGWQPRYELRLDGNGTARLTQLAQVAQPPAGYTARIAQGSLSDGHPQRSTPLLQGKATPLITWQLPVTQQQITLGPLTSFTIALHNTTGSALTAGEATIYHQGVYLGVVALAPTAVDGILNISNRRP